MRIQGISDSERLTHPPRARCQIPLTASPSGHDAKAFDRIDGPKEHGARLTYRSSDHVQTPMDAIAEIDVSGSRGPEHGCVASRPTNAGRRVGSRIIRAGISLDFNDDAGRSLSVDCRHESCAKQIRGYALCGTIKKSAVERTPPGRAAPANGR